MEREGAGGGRTRACLAKSGGTHEKGRRVSPAAFRTALRAVLLAVGVVLGVGAGGSLFSSVLRLLGGVGGVLGSVGGVISSGHVGGTGSGVSRSRGGLGSGS